MFIRVTKEIFNAHEEIFRRSGFGLSEYVFSFRNIESVSIDDVELSDLKDLLKALRTTSKIRGCKRMADDVKTWIDLHSGKKDVDTIKARGLPHAKELLKKYVGDSARKLLYEQHGEVGDNVYLPYYLDHIEYVPKHTERGWTTPAHLILKLFYRDMGSNKSDSETLYIQDVRNKTPAQILARCGYLLETDELRKEYEHYLDEFNTLREMIGFQLLATGIADDSGVDGNDSNGWYSWRADTYRMDRDGQPSRVVIDVLKEEDKESRSYGGNRSVTPQGGFWDSHDEDGDYVEADDGVEVYVPIHPFVVIFDLKNHLRLRIHVGNLKDYEYDANIRNSLILPQENLDLIDTLLDNKTGKFADVVKGKSGGIIILCEGVPGTGKTLTAEVYAEHLRRPLYTVQCSQLGTDPEELEKSLTKCLNRAARWQAILLLDEADVYVHERGDDLMQNAIVGVFLRVLEYYPGVLFLTTNRNDLVDDAILSRCTAKIHYQATRNWRERRDILEALCKVNKVDIDHSEKKKICENLVGATGRDIKNILKLAMLSAESRKCDINVGLIEEMKKFKPTG